jgi:hypothetical protein
MATSTPATKADASTPAKPCLLERVKPFFVPYYLGVYGLLGAITVGFVILVAVIVLVATNFNVLGWME